MTSAAVNVEATPETPSDGVLNAALDYAQIQLHVFPVKGKIPTTTHGFHDATTNSEQIREWFTDQPLLGVAIATGQVSGIDVLDIDGAIGLNTLAKLSGGRPQLPRTPTSRTPGGGWHALFNHHEGLKSNVSALGPGIDVRADGGYIVAPPSPGEDTGNYHWADGRDLNLRIQDWPGWAVQQLEARQDRYQPVAELDNVILAGEGRNQALTSLAGSLRRRGLNEEEIYESLLVVNKRRCRPPLPPAEVGTIARSVSRYQPGDPLTTPEDSPNIGVDQPVLWLRDLMQLQVPETLELIEDLVEAGAPGTIAGVPEIGKGWLALELAYKVAAGTGKYLDRYPVKQQGPVLYWWEDTSVGQGISRNQQFVQFNELAHDVPLAIRLMRQIGFPRALDILQRDIETERYVLVILDSLYNFAPPGVTLKDEEASQMLRAIGDLAATTGCSICFVDHSAWPTEFSEGSRRSRAYGSVFKGAASRWGLYLDPRTTEGEAWFSARGNNIQGCPRTLAIFDKQLKRWKLVEAKTETEAERRQNALDYVADNPGCSLTLLYKAVGGKQDTARTIVDKLVQEGELTIVDGGRRRRHVHLAERQEDLDWR